MYEFANACRATGMEHPIAALCTVRLNVVAPENEGMRVGGFFLPKGMQTLDVTPDEERRLRGEGKMRGLTFVDGASPDKDALSTLLSKAQSDLVAKVAEADRLGRELTAEKQAHALTKQQFDALSQSMGLPAIKSAGDLSLMTPVKSDDAPPMTPTPKAPQNSQQQARR